VSGKTRAVQGKTNYSGLPSFASIPWAAAGNSRSQALHVRFFVYLPMDRWGMGRT
jgi:hypothetical protein